MVKRVIIISNVPQHYRIALFNEIDRQLKEKEIELKVVFASKGYSRRKSKIDFSDMKFNFEILESSKISLGNVEKTMFTYGGINGVISKFSPDKIIVAGFGLATLKIYLRSFFQKISYIIWSEAVEYPGRFDSAMRKFQRRLLVKRASAFVSCGFKNKEYLLMVGAPAEKIFFGINTVDTKFFSEETNKIRATISKQEKKHLLYVGYLVPRKNVGKVIEVIEELSKTRRDFVLDIIGDGSDKPMLEKMVAEKKLNDVVSFHNFIQKDELPKYFAMSYCFLFQTNFDVWGLVLNEAMAAGATCISSVNAGATYDLIKDGETGFAMNFNDTVKVADKINFILDNEELSRTIGENAGKFIEEHASIKKSAEGFIEAIFS